MTEKKIRIWDAPIRLFHLALLILVSISLYTGLVGGFKEMEYHMLSGYGILGLILFRLAWGFAGSQHARFQNFISPGTIIPYAKNLLKRDSSSTAGHNPLGALSVVAMLVILLVQATTGLFTDDDIMTEGPLTHLITSDTGDLMTTIHHYNAWVIYFLVGLHITAIAFYEILKGERLILPMITGRKKLENADEEAFSVIRELAVAAVIAGVCAGAIYYILNHL